MYDHQFPSGLSVLLKQQTFYFIIVNHKNMITRLNEKQDLKKQD